MFGFTSSSSETSVFTPAVEGWSDVFQKDHCKQLSMNGEEGYVAMV